MASNPLQLRALLPLLSGLTPDQQPPRAPAIAAPGPEPRAYNLPGIAPQPAATAGPLRAPGIAPPSAPPPALTPTAAPMGPLPSIAAPKMGPQPAATPAVSPRVQAAQQAEDTLRAQGPPQYHGKIGLLEKVGDTLGRLFVPGVEQRLGVGTLGYQDRLGQAEQDTANAEKDYATESAAQANAAKPEEAQAKIDQANAKLDATQAADAAKLTLANRKLGLDANGNPLPDEQLTPDELEKRKLAQANTAYRVAQTGVATAQQALDEAKRAAMTDPNNPAYQLAVQKAQAALKNATTNQFRQGYLIARLTMEGIEKDPALLSVYRAALGPDGNSLTDQQIAQLTAQNPRDNNGNPAGMSSQFAPTTTTRNRGQQAEEVMPLFDSAEQHIVTLAPELGPAMGRWTDFIAGRGGFADPKYSQLRTELDLLKGAYSRFHLNTELGYKTFDDFLNASQSPENLLASLAVMRELAQRYESAGQGFPNGGQPPAAPQPGHMQPGKGGPTEPKTVTQAELAAVAKASFGGDIKKAEDAAKAQGYTIHE